MSPEISKLRINLLGPFTVVRSDGTNGTPRGRKSCGVLALLATSPVHTRSRKWLQDKLWSDRGQDQAAASLRQCLVEIRRSLGFDRALIQADKSNVSIDSRRIEVDVDCTASGIQRAMGGLGADLEFLEGIDIRDSEFEDWLREMRSRLAPHPIRNLDDHTSIGLAPEKSKEGKPNRPIREQLVLTSFGKQESKERDLVIGSLVDVIAKILAETGSVMVLDHRGEPTADPMSRSENRRALHLQTAESSNNGKRTWRLLLKDGLSNEIVWSSAGSDQGATSPSDDAGSAFSEDFLKQANMVANVVADAYLRLHESDQEQVAASTLCKQGAAHFFRLGKINFDIADQLFERAYEMDPRGIYLAWRAYLRTFCLAEQQFDDRDTLSREAVEFINMALIKEPFNSYVLSFAAQVHYLISRSYVAAYEFAERSVECNRANSIGWSILGTSKCYLGKLQSGIKDAEFAARIGGAGPNRFQLLGQASIANMMARRTHEATRLGEVCHLLAPRYAPALRCLSVLYLHCGREADSWRMVENLRVSEPDFSYDVLKDPSYPAAGLNRSGLLDVLPDRSL